MEPDVWHSHLKYNIMKVVRIVYLGKWRCPLLVKENFFPVMYLSNDPQQWDYKIKLSKSQTHNFWVLDVWLSISNPLYIIQVIEIFSWFYEYVLSLWWWVWHTEIMDFGKEIRCMQLHWIFRRLYLQYLILPLWNS